MSETNKIFSFGSDGKQELSEEKLMAYLEGKLSPAEQHEIEEWLAEEGMESDALEGLHQLESGEARISINKINNKLRKKITTKKRIRRPVKMEEITWVAIVIILLLTVIAYIAIRKTH